MYDETGTVIADIGLDLTDLDPDHLRALRLGHKTPGKRAALCACAYLKYPALSYSLLVTCVINSRGSPGACWRRLTCALRAGGSGKTR